MSTSMKIARMSNDVQGGEFLELVAWRASANYARRSFPRFFDMEMMQTLPKLLLEFSESIIQNLH